MTSEVLGSQQMQAQAATAEATAGAVDAPFPEAARRWYSVGVFGLVLMFLVLDRNIITLLVQPIKRDLKLDDLQMSYLLGFSAVIFYALVGIPLSRLVSIVSRRLLICCGIVFWSLMTALCGVAQNFWQLFLFRVGVGAGESFNAPATYSMMADMFPRERLPRAIAFLNVGFVLGGAISLIAGGAVIHLLSGVPDMQVPVIGLVRNWQLVFFFVGLPGILVGVLLMLTVPEPKRLAVAEAPSDFKIETKTLLIPAGIFVAAVVLQLVLGGPVWRSLGGGLLAAAFYVALPKQAFIYLFKNWRAYTPMFLGLGISTIETAGSQSWRPSFFQRTYGWAPQDIGYATGLSALLVAPVGLFLGTWLAEYFIKKGQNDGNMRVVALVYTFGFPFAVLAPLMPNPWVSLVLSAIGGIIGMASAPSFNAAMQLITPNAMRGQVTAIYIFIFAVIGTGFGPTFIALITDYLLHDENQLGYALSGSAAIMGPLSAVIIWIGLKSYGAAYARSKEWD